MNLLEIKDLKVSIKDKVILDGFNLEIKLGEIHVIMGPNGSGKSTLSNVICGKSGYVIEKGDINYENKNLLDLSIDQRAAEGIFLAFQHPIEIPGVKSLNFIKESVNTIRKNKNEKPLDTLEFLNLIKEKQKSLQIKDSFLKRDVNVGFSGGEKKSFDILHMLMLDPKLVILDEIDSGLDIDALKLVSEGVNKFKNSNKAFLIITHYQRLLDYIKPDFIHIMQKGKIVDSGDKSFAHLLEKEGYKAFGK
ncbi:MAG: putative ATP-dependent transporter SufC [Candidatus Anoxychlamydiales bacterium]|nr:putative ATP-dependent transporter SufC [Candidatus Anoxychlamydiales bacterium]NGX41580.1 putative ATP-dependent transporter SufC [Candidatus Anoxychlamydiales bacterium]